MIKHVQTCIICALICSACALSYAYFSSVLIFFDQPIYILSIFLTPVAVFIVMFFSSFITTYFYLKANWHGLIHLLIFPLLTDLVATAVISTSVMIHGVFATFFSSDPPVMALLPFDRWIGTILETPLVILVFGNIATKFNYLVASAPVAALLVFVGPCLQQRQPS